jgi:hypothetical protein
VLPSPVARGPLLDWSAGSLRPGRPTPLCPMSLPQAAQLAARRRREERAAARAAAGASLPAEKRAATELARALYAAWAPPLEALSKAGAAFQVGGLAGWLRALAA